MTMKCKKDSQIAENLQLYKQRNQQQQKNDLTIWTDWATMVRVMDSINTATEEAVYNGTICLTGRRALAWFTRRGLEGPHRIVLPVIQTPCGGFNLQVLTRNGYKNGSKTNR
jgi:hypothetical protein